MTASDTHHDADCVPELTDMRFAAWVGQALPGDRLEYHRGALGIDRTEAFSALPEPHRRKLGMLANAAFRASEAGLIDLVQVRLGPGRFAYLAVARTKPRATPIPLASLLDEQDA